MFFPEIQLFNSLCLRALPLSIITICATLFLDPQLKTRELLQYLIGSKHYLLFFWRTNRCGSVHSLCICSIVVLVNMFYDFHMKFALVTSLMLPLTLFCNYFGWKLDGYCHFHYNNLHQI